MYTRELGRPVEYVCDVFLYIFREKLGMGISRVALDVALMRARESDLLDDCLLKEFFMISFVGQSLPIF